MDKESILHQMIDEELYPGRPGNAERLDAGSHYDVEKFLEEIDEIESFDDINGEDEPFIDYMVMWGEIAVVRKLLEKGEKSNIYLEDIVDDYSSINFIEYQMKYLGTMEKVNEYRLQVIELFFDYNAFRAEDNFWSDEEENVSWLLSELTGQTNVSKWNNNFEYKRNLLKLFLEKRGNKIHNLSEYIYYAESPEEVNIFLNHGAVLPDASTLPEEVSPNGIAMLNEAESWLCTALSQTNNDMLNFLLDNCNYDKKSLTTIASRVENENQLELLIKAGAVLEPDKAEFLFLKTKSCSFAKYLIDNGVDLGVRYENGYTKLMMYNSFDMFKLLLSYEKRDINDVFEDFLTFDNCKLGYLELKALFENGLKINDKNIDYSVLIKKIECSFEAISLLMENGADINIKGSDGKSLFEKFFYDSDNIRIITYMLENGAILDADSEQVQDRIKALIFKIGIRERAADCIGSFVDCIDKMYPELLISCGLNVIVNTILSKEVDINKNEWLHVSTVIVPENVYEIPQEIFMNNTEINVVVFHGEVRSIGRRAFYGCTNLRQLVFLNNGVCIIGEEAFSKCDSLQDVSIANGTWIGKSAFKDCLALKDIRFTEGDEIRKKYREAYTEYYGEPEYLWAEEAFENCIKLEKIEDFWVTGIGKSCFLGCRNLQVVKGEIWRTIGDYAFWGCNLLKSFTVKYVDSDYTGPWDTPTVKLGKYVFPYNEYEEFVFYADFKQDYDDISLHTAKVQEVLSREPYCYEDSYDDGYSGDTYDDYSWDEDYIESTQEYWNNLYAKSDNYLEELEADVENKRLPENIITTTVKESLEEIPGNTRILVYASNVTTVGLPSSDLCNLGFVCFEDINKVVDFTLQTTKKRERNPYTYLEEEKIYTKRLTFEGSSIEGIEIPPNMMDISYAFSYCKNLKKVIFSSRCKTQNMEHAFSGSAVESCKLPGTVENMDYTFDYCENLTEVEFWREPVLLKNLYNTFCDCKRLKEFTVPASVEDLNGTFSGCLSLKRIIFPDNSHLKEIGNGTFRDCIQLQEIVIPETVDKIASHVFYNCISLEKVIILGNPEFEDSIKDTFDGCIMLKKIICNGQEIVLD